MAQPLPTTPARHLRRGDVIAFAQGDSVNDPPVPLGTMVAVLYTERAYVGYPTLRVATEGGAMFIQPDALVQGFTAWAGEGLEGVS
jgi:hypothetical protein